jgi:hypothetical protein
MTLTKIEYLLAVAKERSFRGAADSRFISQPLMVKQLIRPLGHAAPDPSQQVPQQVFHNYHCSKPLKASVFSPSGPLPMNQLLSSLVDFT